MKYVPHAAAIALTATQAAAGGLANEIVEAPVVVQEETMAAPTGSSNWVIPVLILGALAAVALTGDDDESTPEAPAVPTPAPPA